MSAGKRRALLEQMQAVGVRLGYDRGCVVASDSNPAYGLHTPYDFMPLMRYDDETFMDNFVRSCEQFGVTAIVPTHEREYKVMSQIARALPHVRIIWSKLANDLVCDKLHLATMCSRWRIPYPRTWRLDRINGKDSPEFPLWMKDRDSTVDERLKPVILKDWKDVAYWYSKRPDAIVQEYITGHEGFMHVFYSEAGDITGAVPCLDWAGRDWSMSVPVARTDTWKSEYAELAMHVSAMINVSLGLDRLVGPVDIDYMWTERGLVLLDINCRMGDNFPLAVAATEPEGMGTMLFQLAAGQEVTNQKIGEYKQIQVVHYDNQEFEELR